MSSFRKIFGPARIDTDTGGAAKIYSLNAVPGGQNAKVCQIQIVILEKSSTAVKLGATLNHGPDGSNFVQHSVPIADTTIGSGAVVLSGDAGSAILGEWLKVGLRCLSTSTPEWAHVEVYMMLKPF